MPKEKVLSQDALAVLSECEVKNNTVLIKSTNGLLPRKLYEEVDFALRGIGGKWDRKAKAHVFGESQEEIREMLEGCIQTGLATPLQRNGYFPTPMALADRICALAEIEDGHRVLEPSAGSGNIIQAILATGRKGVVIVAVENDVKRCKELLAIAQDINGHNGCYEMHLIPLDFISQNPAPVDRVIMNPPFGNINGQSLGDIAHIMHAWEILKPGGRLVSIASSSLTFRREKKAVAFREHVAQFGRFEELPEKSFKESGTLVKTIVVVLNKP